tara:strand:+ start:257 stop:961 length:705 start_codon:yes stop_codon:yes gene_type:complete
MNQLLKLCETRKLFYSEYLYKLVLRNELNVIFRTELQKKGKLSFAKSQLDEITEAYQNNLPLFKRTWRTEVQVNVNDYLDAMDVYATLKNSDDYRLRIDPTCTITLFSNNKDFLLGLANRLKTEQIEFWEPNDAYVELLTSKVKIVIVDEKPKLKLKVYFNSKQVDSGLGSWIIANTDKCKVGTVALECISTHGYLNGFYMYIRDEKVLNLVTLLAGNSIRSVEKLVYKEDIDK